MTNPESNCQNMQEFNGRVNCYFGQMFLSEPGVVATGPSSSSNGQNALITHWEQSRSGDEVDQSAI